MRRLFALAAIAGLSACASFAPLEEAERARVRAVVPVAARFPPKIEFKVPPGKTESATTFAAGAAGGAALASVSCGPFFAACFALVAPFTVVTGTAVGVITPFSEGLESVVERARGHLRAPDVQKLLMLRFSERVTRLTPYRIVSGTSDLGPQSPTDEPSYSELAANGDALVAEVAIGFVGATLTEPSQPLQPFGADYASRPVQIRLSARMRLIRPSDGTTVMKRNYFVYRYARRMGEYDDDGTRLLKAVSGAIDEIATRMVDDTFLLRRGADGTHGPEMTVVDPPLPARHPCLYIGFDCEVHLRVPKLDTASPRFRWEPFPQPHHLEAAPWLRRARNFVYDFWIFGGDDDRIVEGLKTTEYTPDPPLANCMRFSWAVRVRFDTDSGPRTVEWNRSGAPFITPCSTKANESEPSSSKP